MSVERRRIVVTWDHLVDIEPGLRMLEGRVRELYSIRLRWAEDDYEMCAIAYERDPDLLTFARHINTILVHYAGPGARHPSLRSSEVYDMAYAHLMAVYNLDRFHDLILAAVRQRGNAIQFLIGVILCLKSQSRLRPCDPRSFRDETQEDLIRM